MALNNKYVATKVLQEFFIDKDTGLPNSGGYAKFFRDLARNVPKNIYQLSGTPPDYSYTSLGAVLNMTSVGTPTDGSNNDIIFFALPWAGSTQAESELSNAPDNYYVEVYNSDDQLLFTRKGWPYNSVGGSGQGILQVDNFVANGQFSVHNTFPNNGLITADTTAVAPGGWYYVRNAGSTATDHVTFDRNPLGLDSNDLTGYPRYGARVKCTAAASLDNLKALEVRFQDVNKFASSPLSENQLYTISFWAYSNSGTTSITSQVYKNFGTGGSASTTNALTTYAVTTAAQQFNFSFNFGDNTGNIIVSDDDYVAIRFSFLPTSLFDVTITDVLLTINDLTGVEGGIPYPVTTQAEVSSQSLTGYIPDEVYDGSNLYLPIIQTKTGFDYDRSRIGTVVYGVADDSNLEANVLPFNGTRYETLGYSSIGIPYSRLQSKLFSSIYKAPIFGTGTGYFTAVLISDLPTQCEIVNNDAGSVNALVNGAVSTGFAISRNSIGAAALGSYAYFTHVTVGNNGLVTIISNTAGLISSLIIAGDSGFTVTTVSNNAGTFAVCSVECLAASSITAGHYFKFKTTTTEYVVWYKKDGSGTEPVTSGTKIPVDINSSDTGDIVGRKTMYAINSYESSTVTTTAASSITQSSYLLADAVGENFLIWFNKDGAGVKPTGVDTVGRTAIEVAIISSDTAAQVADKMRIAINMKYFFIPNIKGSFIRIFDNGTGYDPSSGSRITRTIGFPGGENIGSYQYDVNKSHQHAVNISNYILSYTAGPDETTPAQLSGSYGTESDGSLQSNPRNFYFNAFIYY